MNEFQNSSRLYTGDIPLDLDPHSSNLYYKIRELTQANYKLSEQINDKLNIILRYEKEIETLKRNQALSDNYEREVKKAQDRIELLEKELEANNNDSRLKIKKLNQQIDEINRSKEHDLNKFTKNLEVFHQKIQSINHIEMENKVSKELIEDLKKDNELIKKEAEEMLRKKEINNQNKYSQLKKKMIENLHETKESVTNLNLEYIDVSNKLTILQNHQLIAQIEYQVERIEELETAKQILKKHVSDLQRDIEIHKEVEISLAEKAKMRLNTTNQSHININSSNNNNNIDINNDSNNNNNTNYHLINNFNLSEMQRGITNNYYEKKLLALEKSLKTKTEECERLKLINGSYKERFNAYEKKYSGLFNFFEESLSNFFQDEVIKSSKDLYINIENIKKCDFNIFSSEEKYALLVLMMKYLLPIVSLNMNSTCNIGNNLFETNLNVINRRFNLNERYLRDPELKRALIGKNNKMSNELLRIPSMNKFSNAIPVLRRTASEIDSKIKNNKYKAVFL